MNAGGGFSHLSVEEEGNYQRALTAGLAMPSDDLCTLASYFLQFTLSEHTKEAKHDKSYAAGKL